MKTPLLLCLTSLLVVPAWGAEISEIDRLPAARYAAMGNRSPFALATPAAPAAVSSGSFAANWFVSGIGRLGDEDFVTIKARDLSAQFSLFGREPQNGVSLASVSWSEMVGKSIVILQKGTETARLEFNEADLRGPQPSTASSPAGAAAGGTASTPKTIASSSVDGRMPAAISSPAGSPASNGPKKLGSVQRRVQIISQPK